MPTPSYVCRVTSPVDISNEGSVECKPAYRSRISSDQTNGWRLKCWPVREGRKQPARKRRVDAGAEFTTGNSAELGHRGLKGNLSSVPS